MARGQEERRTSRAGAKPEHAAQGQEVEEGMAPGKLSPFLHQSPRLHQRSHVKTLLLSLAPSQPQVEVLFPKPEFTLGMLLNGVCTASLRGPSLQIRALTGRPPGFLLIPPRLPRHLLFPKPELGFSLELCKAAVACY